MEYRTVERLTVATAAAVALGCLSQSTPALRTHAELPDVRAGVAEFLVDHPVTFRSGGVELRSDALAALDSLTVLVARAPELTLSIEGYAATQPDERTNLELSAYRAEAVRVYLALRGVPARQLRARGYGAPRPADEGSVEDEVNRYPDIVVRLEP